MQLIDYTTNIPEENIALDEYLLLEAEKGQVGETLRFWESKDHFVVVGRAGKVEEECFKDRCDADDVKIIRRISGGGTVLQGPGCLNFSLVLNYTNNAKYRDIRASYEAVLTLIKEGFQAEGCRVEILPLSDMAIGGRKMSGNAQARKRKFFLHHGTLLYGFDPEKINHYLKHPPKEPEYRKGRGHKEFIANIPLSREKLEEIIRDIFSADNSMEILEEDIQNIEKLISEKYTKPEWNHTF